MARKQRLMELDILRVWAILLIVLAHVPGYAPDLEIGRFAIYLVTAGLSIFMFVSGYALRLSNDRLAGLGDVVAFVRKRLLRIYPLYALALLLFVVLFQYVGIYHRIDFAPVPWNALIHLFGLQGLLAPRIEPLFTLWFIGVLMLYYAAYGVIAACGLTTSRIVATSLLLLCLFAGLRYFAGVIDNRFFLYYPVFIAGILAGQVGLARPSGAMWALMAAAAVAAVCSGAALWPVRDLVYDDKGLLAGRSLEGEALRLVFSLSTAVGALWLSRAWARRMSPTCGKAVLALSVASYAAYLYHRIILAMLASFMNRVLDVRGGASRQRGYSWWVSRSSSLSRIFCSTVRF